MSLMFMSKLLCNHIYQYAIIYLKLRLHAKSFLLEFANYIADSLLKFVHLTLQHVFYSQNKLLVHDW